MLKTFSNSLGNKQDLPNAIDEIDLVESMNVERIANFVKSYTRVELCSLALEKYKNKNIGKSIDEGYQ